MKLRHLLLANLILIIYSTAAIAQEEEATEEEPQGWETGAGMGIDFTQLFQLNPKQGAGENRIGFGGAVNFFANYNRDRLAWDNKVNWQFGVQKLGAGPLPGIMGIENRPFQKSIDELRLNSKVGYKTSQNSKFFYAADFSFLSQLTKTFQGSYLSSVFPKNDPNNPADTTSAVSKFFSPATMTLSVGIDYKPTKKISVYYSPIAGKTIIVADDVIADDEADEGAGESVHGNPWDGPNDFENAFYQFGSLLRMGYTDKYWEERIAFSSNLALYSNYLKRPENIDVDWNNEIAIRIIEGLQATLTFNVFYDHDVFVQITDYDAPGGVSGLGRRVSLTQQFLLKYNIVF